MTLSLAVTQMLSVGALWICVHCVGMCGPLLGALDVAHTRDGVRPIAAALRIVHYQLGRAVVYSLLGAFAGLFGALLERVLTHAGAVLSVVLGFALLTSTLFARRAPVTQTDVANGDLVTLRSRARTSTRIVDAARRALAMLASDRRPSRAFFLGALLAGMPCMITLWALGLAASVASPVGGALVMLLLVALTTPVLLVSTVLARGAHAALARLGPLAPRVLLGVSSTWLILVGLAGGGLIPHAHVGATLFGRHWLVMFF
jgi:sulfite exporter TauE/SafE